MIIFPAIDLYEKKAVRLLKGDYDKMTVYSEAPLLVAKYFAECGAQHIHLVDLEGARSGDTPNFDVVCDIVEKSGLKAEIGGGIRNGETVKKYIECGVERVILGTAAVKDEDFLVKTVEQYGDKIAVGADMLNGEIAINGWTQSAGISGNDFFEKMQKIGVKTIICTDILKDGAMAGTNRALYRELSEKFDMNITASGGVTNIDDIKALNEMKLYGAIIGKALYTGAIDLKQAIEVTR